jgi:DNA-binding IclR family transcriptional regulator
VFSVANAVRDTERSNGRATHLVPAVATACRILDALSREDLEARTLSELARTLGLPKSTLHNQLSTLQAHGLVYRDEVARRYRLGGGLITLGLAARRQLRSAALVAERLPALAAAHGITFAVVQVADPQEAVLVDCAYPAEDVHVGLALGSRYGVFHGAVGKCMLTAIAPDVAERIVRDRGIPRHTDQTLVDAKAFLEDIEAARSRGWAASAGEFKENHAVAAPLFGQTGDLELIVFGVGFPAQLPLDRFAALGGVLVELARAVERRQTSENDEEGWT